MSTPLSNSERIALTKLLTFLTEDGYITKRDANKVGLSIGEERFNYFLRLFTDLGILRIRHDLPPVPAPFSWTSDGRGLAQQKLREAPSEAKPAQSKEAITLNILRALVELFGQNSDVTVTEVHRRANHTRAVVIRRLYPLQHEGIVFVSTRTVTCLDGGLDKLKQRIAELERDAT